MYKIQTMNKISIKGLSLFPHGKYEVAGEIINPDAVIVRSADMHEIEIPGSVKAIARAGAGVNNIPVAKCTERGIVVFNTPGANANAVKELVIASLLFSSRPVFNAEGMKSRHWRKRAKASSSGRKSRAKPSVSSV